MFGYSEHPVKRTKFDLAGFDFSPDSEREGSSSPKEEGVRGGTAGTAGGRQRIQVSYCGIPFVKSSILLQKFRRKMNVTTQIEKLNGHYNGFYYAFQKLHTDYVS